jgi:O-antigen ligase
MTAPAVERRTLAERVAWLPRVVLVAVAAALLLAAGYLAVTAPEAAVVLALAVLAIGLTAVQPGLIPLAVLPLLLSVLRVGSQGVDLSLSDFALAAATVPAVFLARRPFPPGIRAVLWASAAYQFATLVTVVNNPYTANVVEWFHAWMTVSGALLVGWAVGVNGHGRLGMRLLVATMTFLAVVTIVEGARQVAQGNFSPVYPSFPYSMHKNFVGTVCAFGATITYARPSWVGLSKKLSYVLTTFMVVAILFSQSRQALIGLVAAVVVIVVRGGGPKRRNKLILLLAVPAVLFVTNLVQDQIRSGNQFNSVFQRLTWLQDSMDIWWTDPWFGVGLRWWYTDRFPVQFQPPNAEIEVLTSAGLLGLAAFVVLLVVAVRVAWKLDPVYGSVALAILVNRVTQAQFDLYWTAVQGSVPFLVLGLCIGAQRHAASQEAGAEPSATPLQAPGALAARAGSR